MQLEDIPDDFQWPKAGILKGPSPATSVQSKSTHFIIKNLWYNSGRWGHTCNAWDQILLLAMVSVHSYSTVRVQVVFSGGRKQVCEEYKDLKKPAAQHAACQECH